MNRIVAASAVTLWLLAAPASAQLAGTDTAPGESCAGVATGATRTVADPDGDLAGVVLVCDGTVWRAQGVKVPYDATACTAAKDGTIRFTSATDDFEFCDGSAWVPFDSAASCFAGGWSPTEKIVFATSQTWNGNLGGIFGAHAKCQAAAKAANLVGTYYAWIGQDTNGGFEVRDIFSKPSLPYKLVDGTLIANSWADLTDGSLQNPINKDENGNAVTGNVWTNTTPSGAEGGPFGSCNGWTSSSSGADGWRGSTSSATSGWTGTTDTGNICNQSYRLYCFEQ